MIERTHSGTKQYYTVYLRKNDKIIASGTSMECAEVLKMKLSNFYCLIANVNSGKVKRYEIEQENYWEDGEERLKCPFCHSSQTKCYDSRPVPDGKRQRRYKCAGCGKRFVTIESVRKEISK